MNSFNALSYLASEEQWCWNLFCTTCGHAQFRAGLWSLAHGAHASDPTWPMHHALGTSTENTRRTGSPIGYWPMNKQGCLAQVLAAADLSAIAVRCAFPDWLGYLGLALRYTEDAERADRVATHTLVPQLVRLVRPDSWVSSWLAGIVSNPSRVLTWRDLGTVEGAFIHDKTDPSYVAR